LAPRSGFEVARLRRDTRHRGRTRITSASAVSCVCSSDPSDETSKAAVRVPDTKIDIV
jgi:hypothetical protein